MRSLRNILFGILAFAAFPYLLLVVPRLDYFVYKEVLFLTILDKFSGEKEEEKLAFSLNNFVRRNAFTLAEVGAIDKDSYNDLFRGIYWCDQKAWLLGKLLGRVGIDNRMLMTVGPENYSRHTVSEVKLHDQWVFFDPTLGISGFDLDPEHPLSYGELCEHNELLKNSRFFEGGWTYIPTLTKEFLDFSTTQVFYPHCHSPRIWGNPAKKLDGKRRAVLSILRLYSNLGGSLFRTSMQDFYLFFHRYANVKVDFPLNFKTPGHREYFLARNYQLFFRYEEARQMYLNALAKLPPSEIRDETRFFFSQLLVRGLETFQQAIWAIEAGIDESPGSRWYPHYFILLGESYLRLGRFEEAKAAYKTFLLTAEDIYRHYHITIYRVFHVANKLLELKRAELNKESPSCRSQNSSQDLVL